MANTFLSVTVPSANGAGAGVDISTMGWVKTFVLTGTLVGTVNVQISNDNINWCPLETIYGPEGNIQAPFAANFVRAFVTGYIRGSGALSIGSTNDGTTIVQLPLPAGNGTGTPEDISGLGQGQTITYGGGVNVNLCVSIMVSLDTTTFAELCTFSGPTPASFTYIGSYANMRADIRGFKQAPALPAVAVAATPGAIIPI